VDDLVHVLGDLVAPSGIDSEARPGQVGREGHDALGIGARIRDERGERPAQPGGGLAVVGSPHRRPHPAIGVLEQPRQQLHAEESGRTGQEEVAAGAGAGVRREERRPTAWRRVARMPFDRCRKNGTAV
jgi:hypothetical protein